MNKMLALILGCIIGFGFLGCSEDKTQESYKVKFAHVVSSNTPKGKAADFFAKRVNELSGAKIKVEVFPSAQLVDDDSIPRTYTQ